MLIIVKFGAKSNRFFSIRDIWERKMYAIAIND